MNVKFTVVCVILSGVIALWNIPQPLWASSHGDPPATEAEPAAGGHGAAPAADAAPAAGGHGAAPAADAEATPAPYQLAEPLKGHYDINVLRSARRVEKLRYPLENLVMSVRGGKGGGWVVQMGCYVEFGSESGMAEIAMKDEEVRKEILDLIRGGQAKALLMTSGKIKLKKDMATTINRLLETARVRRIYLTDFRIVFVS